MKKRIISVMAILALMFGPICIPQAPAQILIMDEVDQYAPVGSGTIVLGLLAGAYLVGKKRKCEEN